MLGNPGVECRDTGGNYTLVCTFNNDLSEGTASVTNGIATISGTPVLSGNTMTINLTSVADVQTLQITLSGVTDVFGQELPDASMNMNILIGDVTGDKKVVTSDLNSVRSETGQPVDQTNFRDDVDASGVIDRNDLRIVRAHKGHRLP